MSIQQLCVNMHVMYLIPTDFHLPFKLIWQLHKETQVSFSNDDTENRNPIYKQLNQMVVQNVTLDQPIQLVNQLEILTVTPDLLEKLKQRYQTLVREWSVNYAPFREKPLPLSVQQQVRDYLPQQLQALNPTVAIQSKKGVNGIIAPHRDHARTASLFFLLESNNEETVWWEKTGNFEEFDFFRFADVTKIKRAHSEIIKQNQWYIFNNAEYHSVHPTGPSQGPRTTLCIEFNGVSADELNSLINNEKH
ncbi:MAG: hypothetical protein ACOYNN_16795 [Terrimicrobiaceae bacterium]